MAILVENFPGATVEAKWTDLDPLTGVELMKQRGRVKRQIEQCRGCELYTGNGPVPYTGPAENLYGIIGESPGEDEARQKRRNTGPTGKLLRAMLAKSNLDLLDALVLTTIQCSPNEGRGKSRAPYAEELRACEANRDGALGLLQQPYVLLVGQTALKMYRPDLQLSAVVGNVFLWREKFLVMPVYNPAGIKRDPTLRGPTQTALDGFGKLVRGEIHWTELMRYTCVRPECHRYYDRVDEDCVPYCEEHFAKYGPSRVAGLVRRKSKRTNVEWDELPLGLEGNVNA